MFGYIVANKDELNEEDKKLYQSYYCGLCHELRDLAGKKGQMLLNYDMTFLVILLSALEELPGEKENFRCSLHPMKEKQSRITEATEYAAAMNVILGYYNLMDDCRDEGKTTKKLLADALKPCCDDIRKRYPLQVQAIDEYMESMYEAEKRMETNLDTISGYTGQVMEVLFDWKGNDIWSRDLRSMGFYLGKFIYIMDAYEDRKKDERNHQYNPLIHLYEQQPENYEMFCKQTLTSLMSQCSQAFERLPILEHTDILRNVLYSGVWTKYEYIQLRERSLEEKKKKRK